MIELTGLLIGLIFSLPLLFGIVMIFINADSRKALFITLSICLILGIFLLSQIGETSFKTSLSFLGEDITYSISNTALLMFFVSLLFLPGMILISNGEYEPPRIKAVLLSISLSFGFIAFISGQFMIRYIALDIVGLVAGLLVIRSLKNQKAFNSFYWIFSILRLGDLFLLASILLLYSRIGTLDISQMITAATSLPMNIRFWLVGGFFFAVLVKTAVWPFFLWMRYARIVLDHTSFWVSGMLMPSLGFYLLYRIQPLIVSTPQLIGLIVIISGGLAILMVLLDMLNRQSYDRFLVMSGLWSCFLFSAVAMGSKDHLGFLITAYLVYRFILYLQEEFLPKNLKKFVILMPLIINSIYIGVGFHQIPLQYTAGLGVFTLFVSFWDLHRNRYQKLDTVKSEGEKTIYTIRSNSWIEAAAIWLNKNLENEILTNGIYSLGLAFKKTSVWLNEKVEIGLFTNGFYRLSEGFEGLAGWLSDKVERGMEGIWSWIGKTMMRISEGTLLKLEIESSRKSKVLLDNTLTSLDKYEQKVLRKNLRLDLAWIPLLLVIIFVLILVV
jgi:formate hydrogenlyase subunit 3/multisubunit Na+/H+ antiporter MnhD subunit